MKIEKLASSVACKIQKSKKAELKAIAEKNNSTLSEITRKLISNFIRDQTVKTSITVTELPENKEKEKPMFFGSKEIT